MKTPDEIKKALKCHRDGRACHDCPYEQGRAFSVDGVTFGCSKDIVADALDYIERLEAKMEERTMSETPKCPGCGADMELVNLCNDAFCYVCKCGWDSPVGIDSESAFRVAMRRAEPKNRVLTLEEVEAYCEGGADATPLWYEGKDHSNVNRWMVIDLPELAFGSAATVKRLVNSNFFEATYGEKWRCWLRKPTKEEMEGTPWES